MWEDGDLAEKLEVVGIEEDSGLVDQVGPGSQRWTNKKKGRAYLRTIRSQKDQGQCSHPE